MSSLNNWPSDAAGAALAILSLAIRRNGERSHLGATGEWHRASHRPQPMLITSLLGAFGELGALLGAQRTSRVAANIRETRSDA